MNDHIPICILWRNLGQSYMDTLILTSLLVLMGISNRSPAKNLSHFLQGIWLIGNEMSSGFNRMSAIKAEKPRTCHAGSSGPTYSICKTIVRVLGVQRVSLWNESGWSWEIKGGQLDLYTRSSNRACWKIPNSNLQFLDDFPIFPLKTSISRGFSIAMFDDMGG